MNEDSHYKMKKTDVGYRYWDFGSVEIIRTATRELADYLLKGINSDLNYLTEWYIIANNPVKPFVK